MNMPNTIPPYIVKNDPNEASLPNTTIGCLIDKATLRGTLQGILYGLKSKSGKDILKSFHKCGQFVPRGRGVSFKGYANQTIRTGNTKRCLGAECPDCSSEWVSKEVAKLSKALQGYQLDGGEMAFITIKMKPTREASKGIEIMQTLMKKIIKKMNNDARGVAIEDRGIGHITIEKTISSKWAYKDENGNTGKPFAYLHTHLHLLVGTKRKGALEQLIENLRNLASTVVIGSGGWGLFTYLNENDKRDGKITHGFDVQYLDNTDALPTYLNKAVSLMNQSDRMALEMNAEGNKTGIGMGLGTYLQRYHNNPDNPLLQAHKKNIRTWFRMMFNTTRNKGFNIDYWIKRFEKKQDENARKWLDDRGYGEGGEIGFLPTRNAFVEQTAKYQEWHEMFQDTSLHPKPRVPRQGNRGELVFSEMVCRKLYRSFNLFGLEGTLKHLFRVYHFDGCYENCYLLYKEANDRYSPEKQQRLLRMLKQSGLLRGSRVHQHNNI